MDCPLCKVNLSLAERQGVEIDYCPKCRGIWLDRGELEKLIEISVSQSQATAVLPTMHRDTGGRSHEKELRDDSHYRSKPKKRESWLSNLLDFD